MNTNQNNQPRVVVTGLGAQSPLGPVDEFWTNLKAGNSGVRRTSLYDPQNLQVKVAGEADFDPSDYIDRKTARRMARASQLTLVAARQALEDSGLSQETVAAQGDPRRSIHGNRQCRVCHFGRHLLPVYLS